MKAIFSYANGREKLLVEFAVALPLMAANVNYVY
jgi:hypothetical protein